MKLGKEMLLITILILMLGLIGCSKGKSTESELTNKDKVDVEIVPGINRYTPLMSSTPGIPLTVKFTNGDYKENYKFHWTTEYGKILKWRNDNGKITDLGKDASVNDQKVYWAIDGNSKLDKQSFKVYLKVEDSNTSKEIGEVSIEIEEDKDGSFTVK